MMVMVLMVVMISLVSWKKAIEDIAYCDDDENDDNNNGNENNDKNNDKNNDNGWLPAGPWTVFAPTNSAFMNLPMKVIIWQDWS